MAELDLQRTLAVIVNECVRYYARKCWWAEEEDLRQEAWIAAHEARKTWDPARGKIAPYASTAIRRALGTFLIRASSPVSSSWHARHELIALKPAPVEVLELFPCAATWADELLDEKRWRVRLWARIIALVDAGDTDLDYLLGETKRVGRPPAWLLEAVTDAKERLAADDELRAIWNERGDLL